MGVPKEKPKPIARAYMDGSHPNASFVFVVTMLVAVLVIALIVILSMAFQPSQVCDKPASLACLDQRVEECLALEKYTRQECIDLVGSK